MKIAEELKIWLPKILQSAKPYYTPSDIEKGSRWESEINLKLSECLIGLICLTKDNTDKPWILFEAGALSNRLDKSKVCPILFGLKKSEVTGPLARFQLTDFNKNDFFKLVSSINNSLEELAIDKTLLNEVFEAFYPKFEQKVNDILSYEDTKSNKPQRTDRDILEEILDLVRKNNNTEKQEILSSRFFSNEIKSDNEYYDSDFNIGDIVTHERFGIGEVLNIEISKNVVIIEVAFKENGRKRLIAKHAKLKKL